MSTELKKPLRKVHNEQQRKNYVTNGNRGRVGRPIVLSTQRFNKIVNNATTNVSKSMSEAEKEQKYKEQLKAGSDELVAKFEGNMQRTQEQKLQQIKDQMDKKNKQAVANYEQAKENEAQKRRQKIAKAEQIMERLKPGPRELHSAALQSEVLRARNVQRSINEEFERAMKKQEQEATKTCNEQTIRWIGEEQQRLNERKSNCNAYKKELLQTINANQKQRGEERTQMIKEQQAAREARDIEIKTQMEKERAIMEKKREALRKNALEAMKMVEQRRLRESVIEGLEDRLCSVYNAGKSKLDALRTEQAKKLTDERQQKIEVEVNKLNNSEDRSKALESERIRRDISTMQLKFTAEEQEKVRKDKAAKQARIEAYVNEMKQKKEADQMREEEKRIEIAQRLRNTEVNYSFAEKEKEQKLRQFQNVRSQLTQQIDDNKRRQLAQKQAALAEIDSTVEREHKYFFEYARNLMEDAQQKNRPLYPFVKVVNQYKRENKIDCEPKTPKHLQSNVPIGEKSTKLILAEGQNESEEGNATKQSILENCSKINEIIATANSKPDIKTELVDDASASGDIATNTNVSDQFRYSMDELKKMNTFCAPTCH